MQLTPRERLMQYAHWLQGTLFEMVEQHSGSRLSEKGKLLAAVLDRIPLTRQLPCARGWRGRPCKDRHMLACAFIGKAVLGLETTRQMIERLRVDRQLRLLCGWNSVHQLPHEATFSRAFQEFAETELPQRLHEALVVDTQKGRLVGHISRDATAIDCTSSVPLTRRRCRRPRQPPRPRALQVRPSLTRRRTARPEVCQSPCPFETDSRLTSPPRCGRVTSCAATSCGWPRTPSTRSRRRTVASSPTTTSSAS